MTFSLLFGFHLVP
jgi:hypothetical protein